jgi:iron-sulfur cluster assembly protein
MLAITENAIDAIKRVAPGDAGLRFFASELSREGDPHALEVEVAEEPHPEDRVLDARGAHIFLEPRAAALLDDKVLDAILEGASVRFAVADRS